MISGPNSNLVPAPATNIDLSFISAMLATLSDPAASLKLLGDMQKARLDWAAAEDFARSAMAESTAQLAADRATIAKEREAHDAAIAKEREECTRRCALDMADVRHRAAETERMRQQAHEALEESTRIASILETRLNILKQAGWQ